MTLHKEVFDKNYFENGIKNGISLYENYRWLPEVSLPIANYIKQRYKNKIILDYGCAKGFLVHALRLLNVISYGFDISNYALKNCHKEVKPYLYCNKNKVPEIQVVFIKDVLEHIKYENIDEELNWISTKCEEILAIIPLGENNKYRISEYGFDKTHIIKENEEWWIKKFINIGFTIDEFYYKMEIIKKNWHDHHDFGNAFFFLKKL